METTPAVAKPEGNLARFLRKTGRRYPKLFVKNGVAYFFWPAEVGFGEIKIGDFKIPIFPVKPLDYEPVQVVEYKGKPHVLSRYHYRVLTYFNRPQVINERVVVDFMFGSHTPFVYSTHSMLSEYSNPRLMHPDEFRAYTIYVALFKTEICSKITKRIDPGKLEILNPEGEEVPEYAILRPEDSIIILCVGVQPVGDNVLPIVSQLIHQIESGLRKPV